MKTLACIFGTRPEAIKMAPVCRILGEDPTIEMKVVVTGQHREMLDQVLDAFEIVPDIDLDAMRSDQSLITLTSRLLVLIGGVLSEMKPDLVLVHGDTTTALAASLAAFYLKIPVGHVEAGLRTFRLESPWPEELNRQVIGRMATVHFAPTEAARRNLLGEGVPDEQILVTGNTVVDAVQWVSRHVNGLLEAARFEPAELLACNSSGQKVKPALLEAFDSIRRGQERLVLVTGHRRENLGAGLSTLCDAIKELATLNPDTHFVYPVHLNPRVSTPVHNALGGIANVHLLPPLDYLPFVMLMSLSSVVITDSGGIQEEAPSLGVPVVVSREVTERQEGVESGHITLVGTSADRIIETVQRLLDDGRHTASGPRRAPRDRLTNPFGDGRAASRIAEACRGLLGSDVAEEVSGLRSLG